MTKVEGPPVGTVLAGKYRLDRVVGKGGMGVVYEARHLLLESTVAIKALTNRDPVTVTRFLNEARAAAKIKSDYCVQVSDVGTSDDGTPFMVMELLEGEDLGHMAHRRGALPCEEAVDYMLQALAGLSEAHSLGIVHRDLKPGNLFVTWRGGQPDRVKILDFGISKRLFDEDGPKVTTGSSVLGSPAYMAPEQLRGEGKVDGRTDIWSAGVILYELLVGTIPFNGPNAGAVFAAILENDPPPPTMVHPELPVGIDDVVLKCLKRKPAERYSTAGELADALVPFASPAGKLALEAMRKKVPGMRPSVADPILDPKSVTPAVLVHSVPPRSPRRPEPPANPRRRTALALLLLLLVFVILGAGIVIGIKSRPDAPTVASTQTLVAPPVTSTAVTIASSVAPTVSAPASSSAPAPTIKPTTVKSHKPVDDDAIFQRH